MRYLLLLVAALCGPSLGSAQTVTSHREGAAVIVEAFEDIKATAQQAWAVVTDYDDLSRFIPDMIESRTLSRAGNAVLVEQKGSAKLFLFSRAVQVRLEIIESPYTWVTSRAVSGSFREMEGRYELKPLGGGMLRFTYTGRIVPDFWVPGFIEAAVIQHSITQQFSAMTKEIRRRAGDGKP